MFDVNFSLKAKFSRMILFAMCTFLPLKLVAQDSTCPAPVRTGPWLGVQTSPTDFEYGDVGGNSVQATMVRQMFEAMATGASSQNVGASRGVSVGGDTCDGSFVFNAGEQSFLMRPIRTRDDGAVEFEGTTGLSESGATIDFFNKIAAHEIAASGASGAHMSIPAMGINGHWQASFEMEFQGDASKPLACQCRSRLQEEIDEMIANAVFWRDIYADPLMRQRPPDFPKINDVVQVLGAPVDPWGPKPFERLITLMYGDLELSYEQAAIHLNSEIDVHGSHRDKPVELNEDNTVTVSGSGTRSVNVEIEIEGSVAVKNCEYYISPTAGNAYACFPEISREATVVHENVHFGYCEQRIANNDVETWADEEIEAYNAEIDFLKNWISDNCD